MSTNFDLTTRIASVKPDESTSATNCFDTARTIKVVRFGISGTTMQFPIIIIRVYFTRESALKSAFAGKINSLKLKQTIFAGTLTKSLSRDY